MQPTITFPRGYGRTKYNIGQRTQQGKIIGIEYYPLDSLLAESCTYSYRYKVMPSNASDEVKMLE
jgi:hypothetical protein